MWRCMNYCMHSCMNSRSMAGTLALDQLILLMADNCGYLSPGALEWSVALRPARQNGWLANLVVQN